MKQVTLALDDSVLDILEGEAGVSGQTVGELLVRLAEREVAALLEQQTDAREMAKRHLDLYRVVFARLAE